MKWLLFILLASGCAHSHLIEQTIAQCKAECADRGGEYVVVESHLTIHRESGTKERDKCQCYCPKE